MPMRYAYQPDVLANLRIAESDSAKVAYLIRIENALADAFDHTVGRSWGVAGQPTTRTLAIGREAGTAVFSTPARYVSDVSYGGTFDGVGWAGETVVEAWQEEFTADGLIYGVSSTTGLWPARIRVTAEWASDSEEEVPSDVRHALTVLTIKQYRKETSSPTDTIGPEGFPVPTPGGWDETFIKTVIDKYAVTKVVF